MGGSGAKERRRLRRETESEGTENKRKTKDVIACKPKTTMPPRPSTKSPGSRRNDGPRPKFIANNGGGKDARRTDGNLKKNQQSRLADDTNTNKKKVKKPKHLKRKLESITDEAEKERLRKEQEEFQRRKEEARKAKKPKVERNLPKDKAVPLTGETRTNTETTPISRDNLESMQVEKDAEAKLEKETSTTPIDRDSDDSSVEQDKPQRKRGNRRRGRKDTSRKVEEATEESKQDATMEDSQTLAEKSSCNESETINKPPLDKESKLPKDSSRYCIGRKPITDFVLGATYPGKVIYVKPFGIFIDINCHTDAFCHVSRLRDDYVEDPTALFQEGDDVQARVVEVDRRQKRITVSLQSENMIELERKSIESRKERLEKRDKKKPKTKKLSSSSVVPKTSNHTTVASDVMPPTEERAVSKETSSNNNSNTPRHSAATLPNKQSENNKSHADLKRERKLARRAERRAQKETAVQ